MARTRSAASMRSAAGLAVVLVVAVVAQPSLGRYGVTVATSLMLYVAGAVAWNLVGGLAGQFSLASSAMVGAGSYATVMVLRTNGQSLLTSLVVAAVVGAVYAAVLGVVLFRLRGFYFTIGTLAAAIATLTWMTTWQFTGATTGLSAPLESIPDGPTLYAMALVLAIVSIGVSIAMFSGKTGLRFMAVRDDEDVARSLGVAVFRRKMFAITVSGVVTALAGGLFALQKASIEPFSAFSLDWSVTFIVMAIVGGIGRVWGPVVGAVLIYYGITIQLQNYPALSSILSGVLLILVIKFLPFGLVGGAERVIDVLRARMATSRRCRSTVSTRVEGPGSTQPDLRPMKEPR